MKGNLLKADGRTLDSTYEWQETTLPNTIASFINPSRTEGVAHEYDLVNGPI
jgi:hypothetical protein